MQVLNVGGEFLAREPSTYAATISMMPPSYDPVLHSAGTAVFAAALYTGSVADGEVVTASEIAAALLAGISADIGLVDSHRDLLSFDRTMTPPERNILRAHPVSSARILKRAGVTDDAVLDAVMYHHERVGGSGYPLGVDSRTLSRLGRCVGLADRYLELISERPSSPAIQPQEAIVALANGEFSRQLLSALATLVLSIEDARTPALAAVAA